MSIAHDHPSLGSGLARRPALISLATVRSDLVEVTQHRIVLGYIEVVGGVFVALGGTRYDLAVEVAQTLIFEDAVAALSAAAPTSHRKES